MTPDIARLYLTAILFLFASNVIADATRLWVDLGQTNRGLGLSVPSGGDGVNGPALVDDVECRRMAASRVGYMYVKIDDGAWRQPAPRDIYATFEVFDERFALLRVQYDKADERPSLASKYTASPSTALMTGSRKWRRIHFALPAARLAGGQNGGADLRLSATGAAIRRVELSTAMPDGFVANQEGVDDAALAAIRVERPPGMEYTLGNDASPAEASLYRALSVTSVESYVDWAGVEPDREGQWDWSKWDEQVRVLRAAHLKWVPFLIAGPAYATPLWFQQGPGSACYRCLEHGQYSKVQSLFNPALRPQIDRFIAAFAARYRDSGIIESVLLGVTGIYGESIYPAGHDDGGWTGRLTGPYHNHMGWWAGDPLATASFREAMRRRYGDIAKLNDAWRTRHPSFDGVSTFLPDKAPSERARSDMAEWYQGVMTEWSAFWVGIARKHFPDTAIYLCTGGSGEPVLGADFTAQAKAIAPHGAGIRITNEGSDFARNFTLVREVATATRHYGTFAGFEPASSVNSGGIVARIYGATASGARQLHEYAPNVLNPEAMGAVRANIGHLVPRKPLIDVAMYASRESWAIAPKTTARFHEHAARLRDIVDFDIVTRLTTGDGALAGKRCLILVESPALEPRAAEAIESWVKEGGIVIASARKDEPIGSRLDDSAAWRKRLFSEATDNVPMEPHLVGEPPSKWSLDVGADTGADWLFGDWHSPEKATEWNDVPDPRRRWTGALAGVHLPTRPNRPHKLRLHAYLSGHSLKGAKPDDNTLLINGHVIGHISSTRPATSAFDIPADVIGGRNLARLEFRIKTWKPSEHGTGDTRDLGLMVYRIEWDSDGSSASAQREQSPVALEWHPRRDTAKSLTRRVGTGFTLLLPALADDPAMLARAFAAVLSRSGEYFPGVASLAPADGRIDRRYATVLDGGVLWFDGDKAEIHWIPRR